MIYGHVVSRAAIVLLLSSLLLASCGGGGGSSAAGESLGLMPSTRLPQASQAGGIPGSELPKPGGGTFFLDPNQGGTATTLHLPEMFWARLVDVHDADDSGEEIPEPRFRELAINENIQSDGVNYTLALNPLTQSTRLIIHAKKGSARFDNLLRAAMQGLPPIVPKNDDGSSPPPFSFIARNACLVLRFDDCLDDDPDAERALAETVHVFSGYPPRTPFGARLLFDPNHGALVGGAFHSTRVLLDLTVSEREAQAMPIPQAVNVIGLPASLESKSPNVSVRIPTRLDLGSGQFVLLTNLGGVPLTFDENGPVDLSSPTRDVVRAMRSGSGFDNNNGFLLDLEPPEVVGALALVVLGARSVGGGVFAVDLQFSTSCQLVPEQGDVLAVGENLLEVIERAQPPNRDGRFRKVRVRSAAPFPDPAELLGNGQLLSTFDPFHHPRMPLACWLSFLPEPLALPGGVSTTAQFILRFSEPMDPGPLQELDSFLVVRGPSTRGTSTANATNIVLGEVLPSSGLDAFSFSPLLPLAHTLGVADPYHVELSGPVDLAGNPLRHELPFVDFAIDPLEATQRSGAVVLRFNGFDEVDPIGFPDLRGQFFLDFNGGLIVPRPAAFTSFPVDRTNPVPSIMIPFGPGVSTPLNPLGSKLHALWRYCDLGLQVRDETKYNLDVLGLSWAPRGGLVISDFFDLFEIRLAHGRFLPDESINNFLLPRWPASGLLGNPNPFSANILVDPESPQKVVHPRALGYTVSPADLFTSTSGTVMLPYPLNRGPGPDVTYTWRDTAVLAKAGPNNQGIPMDIEVGAPLFLETQAGTVAGAGQVPSFGLPLLIEYRCFPSNFGLGLNALDISLAINSSALPAFRAFSSGGINTLGQPVVVNPDTELIPHGGFNPNSSPPGRPSLLSAENVFYIGQLDLATRVSRVHTVWIDTSRSNPSYFAALVAPRPDELPQGTQVQLDFRGATGFSPDALTAPFDASRLNAYGDIATGTVTFLGGQATWTSDIGAMDGARYVQVRLTFLNNLATGLSPRLSTLGIPFTSD